MIEDLISVDERQRSAAGLFPVLSICMDYQGRDTGGAG